MVSDVVPLVLRIFSTVLSLARIRLDLKKIVVHISQAAILTSSV